MKISVRQLCFVVFISLLGFSACNTSSGIFFELEHEVEIANADKGIAKEMSIKKIALLDGPSDYWIVQGASSLFSSIKDSNASIKDSLSTYTIIPAPTGMTEVLSMATAGDTLYAVFRSGTTGSGNLYYTTDLSTWNTVVDASSSGYGAWDLLDFSASRVYLVSRSSDASPQYLVESVENGAIVAEINGLTSTHAPRALLAFLGNNYIFTSQGTVYTAPSSNDVTYAVLSDAPSHTYVAACLADNYLLAVGHDGYVVATNDGLTWTTSTKAVTLAGTTANLTSIINLNTLDDTRTLVSSIKGGLFVLNNDNGTVTLSSFVRTEGNYASASDMTAGRIAYLGGAKSSTERLFVCTEAAGLWSAYYESDEAANLTTNIGLIWSHE